MNIGGVGIGGLDSVMTPLLPGDPSPSLGWPSARWRGDDDTSHPHHVEHALIPGDPSPSLGWPSDGYMAMLIIIII